MKGFDLLSIFTENPIDPLARIYWPYILASVVLALIAFSLNRGGKGFSVIEFGRFLAPKSIYKHPSTFLDLKVFILNQLILTFFFLPFLLDAPIVAQSVLSTLNYGIGRSDYQLEYTFATRACLSLSVFIAADLAHFLIHYLMHKVPMLWRFHKVHHSAEVMTPITLFRVHPVEPFLRSSLIGIFTGIVYGLFSYVLAVQIPLVTILKINFCVFLFHVFGSNLRHSHVWLPYPRLLSYFFISPAQHQIHHSKDVKHLNKNFGNALAVWDWILKTLYVPKLKEELKFGLGEQMSQEHSNLRSFYFGPISENFRSFIGKLRSVKRLSGLKASTAPDAPEILLLH